MSSSRVLIVLGLFSAAALQSHATVLPIHVHRHGGLAAISGTVTAQSAADSGRTFTFTLPAPSISLPAGDWFVSAHVNGDWSEPRLVSIADGDTQKIDLDTFPSARVTARVAVKTGKLPKELKAYFHRVSLEDTTSPFEGNVVCPITKGVAACDLPAGEYDLAFRIPRYVSRYRWHSSLKPKAPLDAGALLFVTGSTLTGRVDAAQKDVRLDGVNVIVTPAAIPGANDEQRHRSEAARLTAHPTRRGLFAFDLPAGQFTIHASYNDLISDEVRVDVAAGHEALLRQPLRLEPQRSVTVHVHPPLDPWSKSWNVQLAKEDETGYLLSQQSLKTGPDGVCTFDHILPGHHTLSIVRSANQTWASQTIDIDRDAILDVDVKAVRVTGSVHIGSKPLAAMGMARSQTTGAAGFFRSKNDGTFLAALPLPEHDTFDEIEIRSTAPPIRRTLKHVRLERRDDGTAELNLDLPSRSIGGMVVDELNNPTHDAMVDVLLPDGELQQVESVDGSFLVTGLEAGRYQLRAASEDRESIDLQEIVLGDRDDSASDVVIPIVPLKHFRGIVTALDGPVLGAALFATRPGDRRPIILSRVDPEGRFDIRFPAATSDIAVAINAPGFAFRIARVAVGLDEETFAVDQNGGTLTVDAAALQAGSRPYLMHNGAALPAIVVARVAEAQMLANLSERVHFQITSTEPGSYSLCWFAERSNTPSKAPCISGVLAPHGTLTLADDPAQIATR